MAAVRLEALPEQSAWDAHIGGDAFQDVLDFRRLLNASRSFFPKVSDTKLVVLDARLSPS